MGAARKSLRCALASKAFRAVRAAVLELEPGRYAGAMEIVACTRWQSHWQLPADWAVGLGLGRRKGRASTQLAVEGQIISVIGGGAPLLIP